MRVVLGYVSHSINPHEYPMKSPTDMTNLWLFKAGAERMAELEKSINGWGDWETDRDSPGESPGCLGVVLTMENCGFRMLDW